MTHHFTQRTTSIELVEQVEQVNKVGRFYCTLKRKRELDEAIETLMNYKVPKIEWPKEVAISHQLTPEEKDKPIELEELSDIGVKT